MIRLADYVYKRLAKFGVEQIFLMTGGGSMHLNDALGREKRINYTCNHHEQACAIAAEVYARVSGKVGVVNVTTGPGGINALNGVFGAWTDSIPMLIISGQVKRETSINYRDTGNLRQLGDQETDIITMVKSITKYSVFIDDPSTIRYHLEKAFYEAEHGRPGPCWLDIPIDVQSTMIDEDSLEGFTPEDVKLTDHKPVCKDLIERIKTAKRPAILAGSGIRLSKSLTEFHQLINKLGIPVTTAWTAPDLIASDDALFCGRQGPLGDRAGNFTVQKSDLLIALGSRLNTRQTSYNFKSFAKNAHVVHVDIDEAELEKPTYKADQRIQAELKNFISQFNEVLEESNYKPQHGAWLKQSKELTEKYPVVLEEYYKSEELNPYVFIDTLFKALEKDDVVISADGTACVAGPQAAKIKQGQRFILNSGCASMGYGLPGAVGAAFANAPERVICLTGDGSIQLNIQELQTIAHHNLPVKIFLINNDGYLSIKLTQKSFFNGQLMGVGASSGVSFPDFTKVAQAYGIKSFKLEKKDCNENKIKELINEEGPILVEVMVNPDQGFEPKLSSKTLEDGSIVSSELEDMYPFLDQKELKAVMED